MSNKILTQEEIIGLKSSPFVESVTCRSVTFTPEFKRLAYRELLSGKQIRDIFEDHGIDSMKITSGTMVVTADAQVGDDVWPAIYVKTTVKGANDTYPLDFNPREAEYFQIRFKMKNFRTGDQVTENGTKIISPYLKLSYCAEGSTSFVAAISDYTKHEAFINANEYVTVTVPIKDAMRSVGEVRAIRIYFGGIESIQGTQGQITIDHIYMGPKEDLPTPLCTVTFKNEDGGIFATQSVLRGDDVVYSGTTPTKSYDSANHYTFKAWDKALTNITEDTVITATYKATPHTFTIDPGEGGSHLSSCSCGYSKSETHDYSYTVTKKPTISAKGTLTGTCSVCAGTTTVTLPKLNPTDYTKTVTKAATCTEKGTDSYQWKTTTYGTFTFTATTAKLGHNYDSGTVTTEPTFTAKGVRTFTCQNDESHTYTEEVPVLSKSLLFDFDNGTQATERYQNYVYGCRNFDTAEAWRGRTQGYKEGNLALDTEAGTLTVTPKRTGFGSIYADSVNLDLNYDPDYAEYFQMRFKVTGLAGEKAKATIQFYYDTGNTYVSATAVSFDPVYLESGEYIVVTGKIQDAVRELEEIHRVVLHVGSFTAPEDTNAVLTFDYAFVGPYEELPSKDSLYFDFTDAEADRIRYNSRTYGNVQFDSSDVINWNAQDSVVSGIAIDNDAGTATVKAKGTLEETTWPAVYMDTYARERKDTQPLSYDPSEAEYVQIRFKMKNFRVGDQVSNNEDGSQSVKTVSPYFKLTFCADGTTSTQAATDSYKDHTPYMDADTWIIATIPLNDAFKSAKEVTRLRIYFGGIESISESQAGEITMDYIFVGKQEDLPTPAYRVTFQDAAGKTLATQLVNRGEAATYTGKTPTKASDSTNHYTFKGWDKALTNITADTTITATYTATAHSWTYSPVDGSDHKNTCACGYSKKEGHGYTYTATKKPTTSATGTLTGTCTACGGTTTVTLPKLNTTDYTKTVTKAATCTEKGTDSYKWGTTTYGTFTFTAETAALGHSYTTKVTAPTCTAQGYTTHTCSRCSDTYKDSYVAAKGHTEVVNKAVAATCTESGLTEGKHCAVCSELLTAQEVVPAKGHSYVYTSVNALSHEITCENCDFSAESGHTYEDGFCICGEPEGKEAIEDSKLKMGHTLNLAGDISMNFAVSKSALAGFDMDTVYVESVMEIYAGDGKTETTTIRLEPVDNGNYYYFTLTGLTAVQMKDRIVSTLYGTKDGQPYVSPIDDYSIADYAYSQLSKASASQSLKTLCADLLRYGTAAQIFKGYGLDNLADAEITEEQKAYLSDIEAVTFGNTNTVLGDLENASVTWAGKSLTLDSKVCLKFIFDTKAYSGEIGELTLRVSYEDMTGANKTIPVENPELYNQSRGYYAFTVDALLAAELRTVVSVQVFSGETPVSATLQYSADTYGNNKTGTLLDLCKALFAYSDSTKAYFSS